MVQITGKYELVKNENLVEHLVALGIPKEKAEAANGLKPTLEVSLDGNKLSLKSNSGIDNSSSEFTLGQETNEPMPLGYTLKSTAKVDGNKIIITSVGPKGETGVREYVFSDSELVLTMKCTSDSKAPVAKRVYKRL